MHPSLDLAPATTPVPITVVTRETCQAAIDALPGVARQCQGARALQRLLSERYG